MPFAVAARKSFFKRRQHIYGIKSVERFKMPVCVRRAYVSSETQRLFFHKRCEFHIHDRHVTSDHVDVLAFRAAKRSMKPRERPHAGIYVAVCAYAGYAFVKLRRVCYDEYVVKLRFKLLYIVFKYVFFIDRQKRVDLPPESMAAVPNVFIVIFYSDSEL